MKLSDAVNVLGLSGHVAPKEVKAAYRVAAMKYHPDRSPAGAEMMKIINAAYDVLKPSKQSRKVLAERAGG